MKPWRRRIASAIIIACAAMQCSRETVDPEASPLDEVLRATPLTSRPYQSRIAGLRWAPLQSANRTAPRTADELQFEGVAGEVLSRGERAPSDSVLHAAGVANLLLGRPQDSIAQLERATRRTPDDARLWNDLAAARYAHGVADPGRLPRALAAADRAIALQPDGAAGHFNRAAILTDLGLRDEAVRAWKDAERHEKDAEWRTEIRRHLAELIIDTHARVTVELDAAFARGDRAAVTQIIRERTEDVRMASETICVTNWAGAFARGDHAAAGRQLEQLRIMAAEIAAINGDRFLEDVVRAIETAPQPLALAKAHLAYRDARIHYRDQHAGSDAELRDVAVQFDALHSPMAHASRYYAGNAMFDRTQVEGARVLLERVLGEIDAQRYPSLAAGVQRQLGLCYGFKGIWTTSLLHLDRARQRFASIREPVNAAFTEATLGEGYDRIGQIERGWRHRTAALHVLNRSPLDQRAVATLIGAVHAEMLRGDFESALSLVPIARRQAIAVDDPLLTAETMVREASALLVARSADAASNALEETKRVAETITDPKTRRRIEADIRVMEAELTRRTDPKLAIEIITPAIEFYRTNNFGIFLPAAYLERGRAHLANGDRAKALEDFKRGREELERQRATTATEIRNTIFDTVPDLFAETVDLLLEDGDSEQAYAVVERARARTLIEALNVPGSAAGEAGLDAIVASLPSNALVVEYALLPRGLVAFCIRGGKGMTVVPLHAQRATLWRRIDELATAIDLRKPLPHVQQLAASLRNDLITPLAEHLEGVETLYIVPDRFLYATPFAALFDSRNGQYLVEQYRIVIAPSGAFLLRRARTPRASEPALIVSDPSGHPGKWLPAARREAAAIARLCPRSTLLGGPDATIERFVDAARQSALIHYAGHAGTDDAAGGFLPLAATELDDGRLDATAISQMSLRRTSLVILSACATMRGSVARVEGMPSISRAFLTAGAPTVLGMLWEIEDEDAARLLLAFHQKRSSHPEPSEALRAAQCELLRNPEENLRHPASWSFAAILGVD